MSDKPDNQHDEHRDHEKEHPLEADYPDGDEDDATDGCLDYSALTGREQPGQAEDPHTAKRSDASADEPDIETDVSPGAYGGAQEEPGDEWQITDPSAIESEPMVATPARAGTGTPGSSNIASQKDSRSSRHDSDASANERSAR